MEVSCAQSVATSLLHAFRSLGPVDVAFSATVDSRAGTFALDQFSGVRTNQLSGVVSGVGEGLGGKCISLGRPVFVLDYREARGITHPCDQQVAGEGLSAIFAVPVVAGGTVHEVVYGAARRPMAFGERLIDEAVGIVARSAEHVLRPGAGPENKVMRLAQEAHAELRAIAARVDEPELRRRLYEIGERLPHSPLRADGGTGVKLSPRELDVLTAVALGCGNVEVSRRLGLTVQTIKSYLKSAMSKLDSHTRGEAVYRARIAGLIS